MFEINQSGKLEFNPRVKQGADPGIRPDFDPKSELDLVIASRLGSFASAENGITNRRALANHMHDISNNSSGSDPRLYLTASEADICDQFIKIARGAGWPNAQPIYMRKAVISRIPAWKNSRHIAKAGLTKALFYPQCDIERKGYVIGKLHMVHGQPVALCDDGKLRSLRGDELTRSKGIGWGRLPDRDKLLAALHPTRVPINYGPRPLSEKLLDNIPGNQLPRR